MSETVPNDLAAQPNSDTGASRHGLQLRRHSRPPAWSRALGLIGALALSLAPIRPASAQTFLCTNCPQAGVIGLTTATGEVNVPINCTITDVNVIIDDRNDILVGLVTLLNNNAVVTLTHPDGVTSEPLFQSGFAANTFDVVIDDEGPIAIVPSACAPLCSGTFRPQTAFGPLSTFDGLNSQGVWTLTVTAATPLQVNALIDWGIELTCAAGAGSADVVLTSKTDTPDPVAAGATLTYVVTAGNNGPDDASGLTISDLLPANTRFLSAVPTAGGVCSTPAVGASGTVSCSFAGATAMGASHSVTIEVRVCTDAACGGTVSNTATVFSATADPTPGNNSATATTDITAESDLALSKTDAPDPVPPGGNVIYTLTVDNNGPSNSPNTVVTDPLPPGMTFISASASPSGSCSEAAGVVTCDLGSVGAANQCAGSLATSFTVTIEAQVPASATNGEVFINNASVATGACGGDPAGGDNLDETTTTVAASPGSADVVLGSKTDSPDPVIAGENLSFTILVSNAGPDPADNVRIMDTIPAQTRFVSAVPSAGGVCVTPAVGGSGTVTCTWAGATAAGGSHDVVITTRVCAETLCGASISNTATVGSDQTDPTPANNSASSSTAVRARADLVVTKSDTPDPVAPGANITYTMQVSNNGPSNSAGTTVVDTLPPGLTFLSATTSSGSCAHAAGIVTCTLGVVAAAAQCTGSAPAAVTITVVAQVPPGTATGTVFSNQGLGSTTNCEADPVGGNNAPATTTIVALPVPALPAAALGLLGLAVSLIGASRLRRRSRLDSTGQAGSPM